MAIERLKFRCYRCNQLLGATPNKAGSVVTCPKCSAELLIPVPELPGDSGVDVPPRVPAPTPGKVRAETRLRPKPKAHPGRNPCPRRSRRLCRVRRKLPTTTMRSPECFHPT